MRRKINPIIYFFLVIVLINCRTPKQSISRGNSPIIVSIDLVDVTDDKVKVTLKVKNLNSDIAHYYIPKIVPGTYQNNNYGRFIEDFRALDGQGNPLNVQKNGDNEWKISNASQLNTITYWVNDTFDMESEHTVFSPTGSNISKNQNFILNLYAFVGYFEGLKERSYRLLIKHPSHLEASTSLTEVIIDGATTNIDSKHDIDIFNLKRYADVADSPIMYTKPDKVTFRVNDIEVLLSVFSRGTVHTAKKLMPQMERVIRAQKNFLGDINSTKKYSILLYLSSSASNDAHGFGALEHNTSTVVVLPESLSKEKLKESLTDVVSHEFFHIVTPLTIHSREIHDFDYNSPKMSQHLWLYEGTTEYFSLLFQIRQGLISKEEFYDRILEKIEKANTFKDTFSFTQMSRQILEEPYLKSYRNVYEKGALISMCLDITLRENSEGNSGIIDLIKKLSNQFGTDVPFDDDKLFKIIKKNSSSEVADFLEKHVVGNAPIDYSYYLDKVGVHYRTKQVPSSYFINEQEPYIKGSETTKEVVFASNVTYNNFLKNLGIQGGDILVRIADKKYTVKNIYDLFGDSKNWKTGSQITFEIKRNGTFHTLTTEVIKPTVEKIVLEQNPDASEKQIKLLKDWIND